MRLSLITATAAGALLLFQAGAMAQTNTPAMQPNATQSPNLSQENPSTAKTRESLRSQIRDMMQKSGFSDVHVMTGSLLIRAKDKDGNPVIMNVSPDSVTEVAEVGSASTDNQAAGTADTKEISENTGSRFVSVSRGDELSSNLIGLDVYNSNNKNIGQIKDIAMNQNGRARAYIVSVGGFLGLGDHYVAINPSDVQISYNTADKKWHATMNTSAAELKSAPEFKYTGRWNASKS